MVSPGEYEKCPRHILENGSLLAAGTPDRLDRLNLPDGSGRKSDGLQSSLALSTPSNMVRLSDALQTSVCKSSRKR